MTQFKVMFYTDGTQEEKLRTVADKLTEGASFNYIGRLANEYNIDPDKIFVSDPIKILNNLSLSYSYVRDNGLENLFTTSNVVHLILDIDELLTFYDFAPIVTKDKMYVKYNVNSDKVLAYLQKRARLQQ